MRKPTATKQFERDLRKMVRRGKDAAKLREVMGKLINCEPLETRNKDHPLKGNHKDRRECHIEPDWLLIYKIEQSEIIFERTGTHSDLF